MPREVDKSKVIMGYKVGFKTQYDETGEMINLIAEVSEDLNVIIKKFCTSELVDVCIRKSSNDETYYALKRYKIKTIASNILGSGSKDLLFIKEFIETGKLELGFADINRILFCIENIKNGIKAILELHIGVSNLLQEVTYNVLG